MNKILALLGVVLILVTGAAAVGLLDGGGTSTTSTSAPAGGAPVASASVSIQSFVFKPTKINVSVGGRVTWTNLDSTEHTATADQGGFDTGTLQQHQSKTVTFPTAGTFTYHCAFHAFMIATVTVG